LAKNVASLEDVQRDGEILVLNDGRRFAVANADDATVASIWLPTMRITVKQGKGRLVRVTNADTGETVAARHLSGG
jgi:hypothetical protein